MHTSGSKRNLEMGKRDDGTDAGSMSIISGTSRSGASSSGPGSLSNGVGPSAGVGDKERRRMRWTKVLLIFALVAAVVAMAVGTFIYVKNQEQSAFENEFENFAREVISLSGQNVRNQFQTVELFSTTISSMVTASNMSWPKVIIPHYTEKAIRVARMSKADLIVFGTIVEEEERLDFEEYMRDNVYDHLQDAIDYLQLNATATELEAIPEVISALNITTGEKIPETRPGPYLVNWHLYPFRTEPQNIFVNNNLLALQTNRNAFATTTITRTASLSFAELVWGIRGQIFQPIFENVESGKMVGVVWVTSFWENYFKNLLPGNAVGLHAVLKSTCGFTSTFEINGEDAVNLGSDDYHDTDYDDLEVSGELFSITVDSSIEVPEDSCLDTLTLNVYPTNQLKEMYTTNDPIWFAGAVLVIFAVTLVLFVLYDLAVNKRQMKIQLRLQRQGKLVANIFPEQIMTRLYEDQDDSMNPDSLDGHGLQKGKDPIADLYLDSTILFADISGFHAWTSQRNPPQVFSLLETLYGEFDKLARKYQVFKVETIGDTYIAATGVPDPDPNHCVNMARFARKCVQKTSVLTKLLETKLGPDTGDLELRVAIHSGQVVAGVLRGDRARFSLFGDSVNTAELLLQHSQSRKVHVSETTGKLLIAAGKEGWLVPRLEGVDVDGHATMKTYWLQTSVSKHRTREALPISSMDHIREEEDGMMEDDDENDPSGADYDRVDSLIVADEMTKTERLVEWNVEILSGLLEQVMAARSHKVATPGSESAYDEVIKAEYTIGQSRTVLEEFQEIITLPKATVADLVRRKRLANEYTTLSPGVRQELRDFLKVVASMYHSNAFHNFEHASHVTASVFKMMKRITDTDDAANKKKLSQVQPLDDDDPTLAAKTISIADLAGHSYGITSDPLTQFAVVFSSIIHDADHPGVTNVQLLKEDTSMARRYKKSIAEQNSVDLVWALLMSPDFGQLRECIYSNEDELYRFRQLVVNIVMATDICDKELGALRKNRWKQAFSEDAGSLVSPEDDMDRKATIVLEHLIQASDVSHTMQHWQIYLHWNECFFRESYHAWKKGRADASPEKGWYKGEIGFFDFYVIPLAKKLESCGVFGVSSAEYLEYALTNRGLWEQKGEAIVEGYMTRIRQAEASSQKTPEQAP